MRKNEPPATELELLKCMEAPVSLALYKLFHKVWILAEWRDGLNFSLDTGKGPRNQCGIYWHITLLTVPGGFSPGPTPHPPTPSIYYRSSTTSSKDPSMLHTLTSRLPFPQWSGALWEETGVTLILAPTHSGWCNTFHGPGLRHMDYNHDPEYRPWSAPSTGHCLGTDCHRSSNILEVMSTPRATPHRTPATSTMCLLERLWPGCSTQLRVSTSCILLVHLYGSETWTLLKDDWRRLQALHMRCQHCILRLQSFDPHRPITWRAGLDDIYNTTMSCTFSLGMSQTLHTPLSSRVWMPAVEPSLTQTGHDSVADPAAPGCTSLR